MTKEFCDKCGGEFSPSLGKFGNNICIPVGYRHRNPTDMFQVNIQIRNTALCQVCFDQIIAIIPVAYTSENELRAKLINPRPIRTP